MYARTSGSLAAQSNPYVGNYVTPDYRIIPSEPPARLTIRPDEISVEGSRGLVVDVVVIGGYFYLAGKIIDGLARRGRRR